MNKDMYAVKYRHKGDAEWRFATESLIISDHEADKYQPEMYLVVSMKVAHKVQMIIIQRYSNNYYDDHGPIEAIKISKMNRYNLRRESEVLEYREFK